MAIKIDFFDTFELNGKTYTGAFPVYSSDAVCTKPSFIDYQNQLEQDLVDTNENYEEIQY